MFSGANLATIYFWRAVGLNKKGNYTQVIADATEALKLKPDVALYNLRGSAYYDKSEYDIAIADFNDALRMGKPEAGIVYHNRGNAWRGKGDYAKAIADYDAAIKFDPKGAFSWQNRGASKQALGDLDGALSDINEAIRLDPTLPSPLNNRAVIWRAKGDFDRAVTDATEAVRLAKAKRPVNIMTPPGSVLITAHTQRPRPRGERRLRERQTGLRGGARRSGVRRQQQIKPGTAKVRLSLLSDVAAPAPRKSAAEPELTGVSKPTAAPPPAPVATPPVARRVALVIGNGAYTHVRPLPNPSNDARSTAKSLRDIGFAGPKASTSTARRCRPRSANSCARRQPHRRGSLLGRPRRAGRRPQLPGAGRRAVEGRQPHLGCDAGNGYDHGRPRRSGPHQHPDHGCLPQQSDGAANSFRRRQSRHRSRIGPRRTDQPWRRLDARRGYADRLCDRARTGEGANSPFSAALSRHIGTPGLEVQQMLTRVRAEIVAATKAKQVPWSNSSLLGEVYLAEK